MTTLSRLARWCRLHPGTALRMPIARFLDRRYPDACWAGLCHWAIGWKADEETLRNLTRPNASCRADASRNGTCWCGKLQNETRMAELGYAPAGEVARG